MIDILDHNKKFSYISCESSIKRQDFSIKNLILDLRKYEELSISYHIQKIISSYSTLYLNGINDSILKKLRLFKVNKYFEKSYYGGPDKDHTFITYLNQNYFLTLDKDLIIDDYIRSILPRQNTVSTTGYYDYKSQSSLKPNIYTIAESTQEELQHFLSVYSQTEHIEYLNSLL